jgi:Ca2+-binding EF-hand superfamily protein
MVEPAAAPTYTVPFDLKKNFTPSEVTELIQVFKHYDSDKNEMMDSKEFKQVCVDLGQRDITDDKVQEILAEVDRNNDGVIQFDEFLHMFAQLKVKEGS